MLMRQCVLRLQQQGPHERHTGSQLHPSCKMFWPLSQWRCISGPRQARATRNMFRHCWV